MYELQISKLFSGYSSYFSKFKSCNVGCGDKWCGTCAKCVFVYTTLAPFVETEVLIGIFGSDLFSNVSLFPLLSELAGKEEAKPFECVGTHEEVLVAIHMTVMKFQNNGQKLPIVLQKSVDSFLSGETDWENRTEKILKGWNTEHFLPPEYEQWIHEEIA